MDYLEGVTWVSLTNQKIATKHTNRVKSPMPTAIASNSNSPHAIHTNTWLEVEECQRQLPVPCTRARRSGPARYLFKDAVEAPHFSGRIINPRRDYPCRVANVHRPRDVNDEPTVSLATRLLRDQKSQAPQTFSHARAVANPMRIEHKEQDTMTLAESPESRVRDSASPHRGGRTR
jgi:hypothetical protein